jgi:hypothetical protein
MVGGGCHRAAWRGGGARVGRGEPNRHVY